LEGKFVIKGISQGRTVAEVNTFDSKSSRDQGRCGQCKPYQIPSGMTIVSTFEHPFYKDDGTLIK